MLLLAFLELLRLALLERGSQVERSDPAEELSGSLGLALFRSEEEARLYKSEQD